MKKCNVCGVEQEITQYCKHSTTRDGLCNICRTCRAKKCREYRLKTNDKCTKKYEKTLKGYLMRSYRNMQSRVTGVQSLKSHLYSGLYILDRNTFYDWSLNNESYNLLFNDYINNGCPMKLAPSVDRIDTTKGYEIGNIRWITHSENSRLGAINRNKKTT